MITNPHISSAAERERLAMLLAEGAWRRRISDARLRRRIAHKAAVQVRANLRHAALHASEANYVHLPTGADLVVRTIGACDAQLLAQGFDRLSATSRRNRFLGGKSALTPRELKYLTTIDHCNHEAIGALSPIDGSGIGIARYVRQTATPDVAELAVTVIDEWQGSGVGTELITQLLSRAHAAGIRCFRAWVSDDNLAALAMLKRLRAKVDLVGADHGVLQFEVSAFAPS
jgi:RimJ/RimL family protein N-acetyltransferase